MAERPFAQLDELEVEVMLHFVHGHDDRQTAELLLVARHDVVKVWDDVRRKFAVATMDDAVALLMHDERFLALYRVHKMTCA